MALTDQDLSAIKSIVNTSVDAGIDKLSLQVGEGFNEVSERLDRVASDVAVLKDDVAVLKDDMREVK